MDQMLQVKFIEKIQLTTDTWQFVFEKPKAFSFQAGQYTTLFLGNDNRDFTICVYPKNKNYFSIVTRSVHSGQAKKDISEFKKNLFALPRGSAISFKKPSGGFTLHINKTPKVFLAGGIGITVFYTIIQTIVEKKITIPVTLFVSFSKMSHMIFYDELQDIQRKNKNIQIIYTLSQEPPRHSGKFVRTHPESHSNRSTRLSARFPEAALTSQDDSFETGRISEELIKKYVTDFKKVEYMIAGGEKMVEDTEKLVLNMKVPEENIRIDIFTGY